MPTIQVLNISKTYRNGVKAVEDVSLVFNEGIYALMGPNGSGKTTTLNIIGGVLKPDKGEVSIQGYSMWGDGYIEARKRVGIAIQDMPFFNYLTGIDNLIYIGLLRGLSISEAGRRARKLLRDVGLWNSRRRRVSSYSGGMRRRLAIAASLIHDPDIIILDEPASGLDPKSREELWSLLLEICGDKTIIFSSHDGYEVERFSQYVYLFHRGRVVEEGEPRELIERYVPHPQAIVWFEGGEPPDVDGVKPLVIGSTARYSLDGVEVDDVLNAFRVRGLTLRKIEIVEPSLSEVFIRLTGEELS